MAVTYILEAKNVRVYGATQRVLEILEQVMGAHYQNTDEQEAHELQPGEERARTGIVGTFLRGLSSVTGNPEGGEEQLLPRIEANLDEYPGQLFNAYRDYLLQMCEEMHITPQDLIASPITSQYVLTIELLLRTVSLMLCRDEKQIHDGKLLLEVYTDFVNTINREGIFGELGFVDSLLDRRRINNFLTSSEHQEWMELFANCIEAQRKLYLNKSAVSNVSNRLLACEQALRQRIVAELRPDYSAERLAPHMISHTFQRAEAEYLSRLPDDEQTQLALTQRNPMQWITRKSDHGGLVQRVYTQTSHRAGGEADLATAYDLLRKTESYLQVAHKLDQLNHLCGWLPYISGALKLDDFAEHFSRHVLACREFVVLPADDVQRNKSAFRGLTRYCPTKVRDPQESIRFEVGQLRETTSPEVIEFIVETGRGVIQSLSVLSDSLGCKLISGEVMHQLLDGQTDPSTAALPAPPQPEGRTTATAPTPPETNEEKDPNPLDEVMEQYRQIISEGTRFESEQAQQIAFKVMLEHETLEELDLSRNPMGQDGVAALLRALPHCKQLKVFMLNQTGMNQLNMRELIGLIPQLPNLEHLDIGYNGLPENSIISLIQAIKAYGKNLHDLRIGGNLATDATMDALIGLFQSNPRMEEVDNIFHHESIPFDEIDTTYYNISQEKRDVLSRLVQERKPQRKKRIKAAYMAEQVRQVQRPSSNTATDTHASAFAAPAHTSTPLSQGPNIHREAQRAASTEQATTQRTKEDKGVFARLFSSS